MISGTELTIIIPAYCAEGTIEEVLRNIPDFMKTIIVVDDCSTDHTSEVVTRCGQDDERIHLIRHSVNQGVGGAMLTGYLFALDKGADVIVKMDSDGQMDPAYLPKLVDPILKDYCDYAKGNRFLHGKELLRMPLVRRVGNLGLSFLAKMASGYWNIFDPANGYTAISRKGLETLNFNRLSKRFFFETSMLLELGLQRMVVKDIYIPAIYGAKKSHLSSRKSLLEFPLKLFFGMLRRILLNYFVRDFTPITVFIVAGFACMIFGTMWGLYHWSKSAYLGISASTGTVMIAVLPLIMGFQFLLQAIVMDIQNTPKKDG